MMKNLGELLKKYARFTPIAFFLLGFIFDTLFLTRIDELKTMLQQAVYLLISGAFIAVEFFETEGEFLPPRGLGRFWKYREAILDFLLGTLLNSYTIFYFKSASSITSILFILILVSVLVLNEFKDFGKSNARIHMALWSLCLVSYFASLAPILIGSMGDIQFIIGMSGAVLVFCGFYKWMQCRIEAKLLRNHFSFTFFGVVGLFTALYFSHGIPPVPLSVSYLGIFHEVVKDKDNYNLSYSRPAWKFWQHGDQSFLARPGDVLYCFVRVFSPTRFTEELKVLWFFHDEKQGWMPQGELLMPITGGRENGFRGVAKKSNFQPGKWQVRIVTSGGREIGMINFEVINDDATAVRNFEILVQ